MFHHNWHLFIEKRYGSLTYLQDPLTHHRYKGQNIWGNSDSAATKNESSCPYQAMSQK